MLYNHSIQLWKKTESIGWGLTEEEDMERKRVDTSLGFRVTERMVGIKPRRTWCLSGVGDHKGRQIQKVL